jgi:NAD(P)-dependent dehydrogenase (short-subunit alcohol dehydrogenase family)
MAAPPQPGYSSVNERNCCRWNDSGMNAPHKALRGGQWGLPLGRIGRPDQMAAAVIFGASEQAGDLIALTVGITDGMFRSTFV